MIIVVLNSQLHGHAAWLFKEALLVQQLNHTVDIADLSSDSSVVLRNDKTSTFRLPGFVQVRSADLDESETN